MSQCARFWLCVSAMLINGAGVAANLQISPVTINFRAEQSAAGISLQNMGETPVYGQVRVFVWDQQGGDDVLIATQELVASPPIVQIGAKASQTIRLVRTGAAAASAGAAGGDSERTYRVLIDEVAGAESPATSGVDIRLRYSVPVFVAPGQVATDALTWQFFRKDGAWMLKLRNDGRGHAQVGALIVVNQAGQDFVISKGLFGYVLAGRTREWRLPVDKNADLNGALTVRAVINAKPLVASNSPP